MALYITTMQKPGYIPFREKKAAYNAASTTPPEDPLGQYIIRSGEDMEHLILGLCQERSKQHATTAEPQRQRQSGPTYQIICIFILK
jgi:hypothetical protein